MKYICLAIFFLLVSCTGKAENQNNETQQPVPLFMGNTQEELSVDEQLPFEPLILDGRPYVYKGKKYSKDEAHLIEILLCNFAPDAIIRWHSFDGIEQLVNLKSIWIDGEIPETVDMSPVSSLYNLEELIATNIDRLPDLTRLEHLSKISISGSYLQSLEGIGAPNLRSINISNISPNRREIDSLKPINNLLHLERLYIHSAGKKEYRIADISNLPSLKRLEIMWVGERFDLQGIENLAALEILDLPGIGTRNLEGIGKLTNLQDLSLNLISPEPSLEFLRGMPNLIQIYLNADSNRKGFPFESEAYQILDLSPLATIKNLRYLTCYNFIIKNLSSLDVLEDLAREDDHDFPPYIQLGGSKLFDETETSRHDLAFESMAG